MTTTNDMQPATTSSFIRDHYPDFLVTVQQAFDRALSDPEARIFTTDIGDTLYQDFLTALPDHERQRYNCRCCANFTRRFGGLVTIDADGHTHPLVWSDQEDVPWLYADAIKRVRQLVGRARVTGVFLSAQKIWGTPQTGPWTHLAVTPSASHVYRGQVKTDQQAMAEKVEDFRTMTTALQELSLDIVLTALPLLQTDVLYRSEKILGAAQWLRALHEARNRHNGTRREHVLWRAIAAAPAGFCHPRGSMLGKLLEDIRSGLPFEEVKRRFAIEMDPGKYRRPQVAPAAGNIAQAEKIIAQLGASGALARRFATLDDLQTLWRSSKTARPIQTTSETPAVFDRVKPKQPAKRVTAPALSVPPITMTFVKFMQTVLPQAETIEVQLPYHSWHYAGLLTAVNPEATPILQWDSEEQRNPVSWYVYHNGSPAAQWGLKAGDWTMVSAVTLRPSMWYNNNKAHIGEGVIFVLDGARDSGSPSLCLFPEILKADFHAIRATMESYSRSSEPQCGNAPPACGVMFAKGGGWGMIRVVNKDGVTLTFQLDRWD